MRLPPASRRAVTAVAFALGCGGDAPVAPPAPGVYSPENRLAFLAVTAAGGPASVVTVRPDGSNRFVAAAEDTAAGATSLRAVGLAWSPDGARLAFTTLRYGAPASVPAYGVEVVGADGTGRTALATGQAKGVNLGGWAPDGRSVVYQTVSGSFSTETALLTASLDGGGARRIAPPLLPSYAAPASPRWAPEGARIAFQSSHERETRGYAYRVYAMAPDGSAVARLVDQDTRGYGWAPDGARVAFSAARPGDPPGDARSDLLVTATAPGSTPVRVTDQAVGRVEPVWSPDGTRIAFASGLAGEADLYVINADGTGLRRLTAAAGDDVGPAWSPDGARIAFASARSGRWDIFVVGADGTGETNLTRTPDADETSAAWR